MNKITDNGIITLHAGDSFVAPLFLNAGDIIFPMRYSLKEGDKLYVGIMEPGQPFECALIRKVLTKDDLNVYGDPELKLSPEDTEKIMPGLYYYEAKLLMASDDSDDSDDEVTIQTVIPKKKVYILE